VPVGIPSRLRSVSHKNRVAQSPGCEFFRSVSCVLISCEFLAFLIRSKVCLSDRQISSVFLRVLRGLKAFGFSDSPLTRFPDVRFQPHPPSLNFYCKQRHLRQSTLGWPLGDAWVALGPPKGHPIPIPIQTQSQSAEGRNLVLGDIAAVSGICPVCTHRGEPLPPHTPTRIPKHLHDSTPRISPPIWVICVKSVVRF
jgi:hypothetical protein